ncbi:hypothetical protein SERLADRAFT_443082 [Serpula lacrymans var. lacrymans S7.9]|uniref:Ketoreductase (KR) domain-containing protein n=1 Tax=Serpula lacrymans var. lacrymans (strain S7.9) TaxID=578457 RepID=F8PBH2_SERL9|nr:uncharacterized protein SERLADRAFT_443082 [Serpula lacrymans var. lacrymans S7.9]EGO19610.1 hypothetical protein SERLADRAFT_443082 [Serpula lacrymans var. lacrymans S7.9]
MSTVAEWCRELERYPYLYPSSLSLGALSLLFCIHHVVRAARSLRRSRKVPRAQERVLILGATSGVGRTLAHQYTARGARVCVVGRREDKLANVVEECKAISKAATYVKSKEKILGIRGDLANVDDMVNLRAVLEKGEHLMQFYV